MPQTTKLLAPVVVVVIVGVVDTRPVAVFGDKAVFTEREP
jgi:hypothetical protein